MIEKVMLAVVLIVALVGLIRIVRRSITAADDPTKSPGCAGCPFDSKCRMQDQPHVDDCGSAADDS